MGLQSQREGLEIRTNKILDQFLKLRMKINEWELSIRDCPISSAKIHQKFIPISKAITELANQALLAKVSTAIHRDILNLVDIIA